MRSSSVCPSRQRFARVPTVAFSVLTAASLTLLLGLTTPACAPPPEPYVINQASVERVINVLAADDMEGRATFSPALWRAADFIADEYEAIGLEPYVGNAGTGGAGAAEHANPYFQHINVIQTATESCDVTINGTAVAADHFACRIGTDSVDLSLDDVEVLTVGDDPMQAVRRIFGAEGNMLVLMGPDNAEAFQRFGSFLARPGGSLESENGGSDPSFVMVMMDSARDVDAASVASLSITGAATIEAQPLANVIGQITGNRPDEYVIFSAHYDHVGVREGMEGDNIFNGANDDASGVTAIIELARYFKSLPKPERTILFLAFTAEESGGYGSRYYAAHVDPAQVIAMFNLEMIGKPAEGGPGSTWLTGFDRSSLGEILNAAVQGQSYEFTPDPYPDQGLFLRSDNAALARLGVPAHSFSTTPMNEDPDYHQPSDEVETLDLAHMTEIIRALSLGAAPIISGEATPSRVVFEEEG